MGQSQISMPIFISEKGVWLACTTHLCIITEILAGTMPDENFWMDVGEVRVRPNTQTALYDAARKGSSRQRVPSNISLVCLCPQYDSRRRGERKRVVVGGRREKRSGSHRLSRPPSRSNQQGCTQFPNAEIVASHSAELRP